MRLRKTILMLCVLVAMCVELAFAQTTFNFIGQPQTWVVPNNVTSVTVDVRGGQGGGNGDPAVVGGKGGRVQTTLAVTPGETLVIYVGGRGGNYTPPNTAGPGGFNGGGAGGADNVDFNGPAEGGGGASDLRQGGNDLAHRVVVAGGGGGAEGWEDADGGDGGGTTGMAGATSAGGGSYPGGGGTQSSGGASGSGCNGTGGSGSLGQGGVGGNGNRAGGGGGGGYYGGGGGGGCFYGSGGGGGSSYSAGINTIHTQGYQTGDGQVTITWVPAIPSASLFTHNLSIVGFGIVMRPPWICSQADSLAHSACAATAYDTIVNTPPAMANLTITNAGGSPLTFPTNAFSFSTPEFTLGTGTNACSSSSPLAPGSQCTVYVTFNPQTSALRTANLTINTNDPAGPQSVALVGTGMNVFYQFGSTFSQPDPDVPECFDVTSSSYNCGTNTGYETQRIGCKLSSQASVLSTFSVLSATTPATLDKTPPLTTGTLYDSFADLISRNLQNWHETCTVTNGVIGGCSGTGMTLSGYLAQQIGSLNPVILELCTPGSACPSHFVVVVGPVGPLAAPIDWVLFDPGWQAANQGVNYLLSSHMAGFSTARDGVQRFWVSGVITFNAGTTPTSSSLTISAYSPVELLITDSQGRQLGNIIPGEDISQIPGSSYFRDYPIADDTGSGASPLGDPTGIKTAYISSPAGLYQLLITGTSLGTFTLVSSAAASDGIAQTSSFVGITNGGAVAEYQIQYSSALGTATQFLLAPSSKGSVPPSQISTTASGLAYGRASQTFNGTVTIKNVGTNSINGPLEIVLTSLTSGVTLVNATGAFGGNSFVTIPAVTSFSPGASATVTVQFKDPSNAIINFTPVVYSGSLN